MWSGSGFVWFKLFLFFRLRLLPRSWQDSSWVRFHFRANQTRPPETRLEVHSLQLSHEIIFTTLGFQEIITSETYHLQPQNQACGNFKNCMIILSPLMHYDAGLDLGPVTYTCCSVVVWWHAYTFGSDVQAILHYPTPRIRTSSLPTVIVLQTNSHVLILVARNLSKAICNHLGEGYTLLICWPRHTWE